MNSPRDDVANIFADALELAESERRAFLERATDGDAELLVKLESLLRAYPSAQNFFRDDALQGQLEMAASNLVEDHLLHRRVGSYTTTKLIGAGGMGRVYLAERSDAQFQKRVAIKFLRSSLDSKELARRLVHERQMLARLEHPEIARLIDGGTTDDGLPYLIMEYVEGVPLDQYCQARELSIAARIQMFQRICAAVAHAHRNLILHCDLKPGNVLVDNEGKIKLLDFGTGRILEEGGYAASDSTVTTFRMMTPRYASPEHFLGQPKTTGTDVYSLGVMLFELLTELTPFAASGRPTELERAVVEQTRPAPSSVVVDRTLRHALKGDLDTIVLKAMRKEPERRYATVDELSEDLSRYLRHQPVLARPDTLAYRFSKFARRNRIGVIAAAAVLSTLVAALGISTWQYRAAVRARELAELEAYASAIAAAESSIRNNQVGEAAQQLGRAPERLRGWEWQHLQRRVDRASLSIAAHRGGITRIRFSADNAQVITAGLDSTIRFWSTADGRLLRELGALPFAVEDFDLQPGAPNLAVGGPGMQLLVLDLKTEQSRILWQQPNGITHVSVDFHPDGSLLAAGMDNGEVILWETRGFTELSRWKANDRGGASTVAFHPAGQWLATGDFRGALTLWDWRKRTPFLQFAGHQRWIMGLAFSSDGSHLASASLDETVCVWNCTDASLISRYHEHHGTVVGVSFVPGSDVVLSGASDHTLDLWRSDDGAVESQLRGHRAPVYAVAVSEDGAQLASGDWGGTLRLWSRSTQDVQTIDVPGGAFAANWAFQSLLDDTRGEILAVRQEYGLAVWSARSGSLRTPRDKRVGGSSVVALLGQDHWLSGTVDGRVLLIDPDSLSVLSVGRGHQGRVTSLAAHSAGDWFVSTGEDSTVRLWRTPRSGQEWPADSLLRCGSAVHAAAVHPVDGTIVLGLADGQILRWDPGPGRTSKLGAHQEAITQLAFDPSGHWLISTSRDGVVQKWDARNGEHEATLLNANGRLLALACSADGSRIALGGDDQMIHLLDAKTHREVARLHGHAGAVLSLQFAAGDSLLLSSSKDGTIRLWDAGVRRPRSGS